MMRTGTAMVALLLFGSGATGQATPPPQHVTIEGHRQELKKEIHDYVSGVTEGPAGTSEDPLQRWREPMCFLIAGLPRPQGEFVLQRLSTAAQSAGAPLTKQHCRRPNFYVVFTRRPQQLLQAWRRHDPSMYGFAAPLSAKEFQDATAPVRAWYNTVMEQTEGGSTENGSVGITASGGATSVDCNALSGVACGEPAPTGLTSWDKSFLRALYNTRQEVRGQRGEIAEHMHQDIAP